VTTAYVDTSCLVAVALNEGTATTVRARMATHDRLVASGLCEAELLSACTRDAVRLPREWDAHITLVHPRRGLRLELDRALAVGYLRGADLWHVAVALYVSPDPAELTFLTLDAKQRTVAATLGFQT
jgi:predicted nucleic acid-binding protein